MWAVAKSVTYLDKHALKQSAGRCAEFVRKAIEAGGVHLIHHTSAKDYGPSLEMAAFKALPETASGYWAGDVAVIQPITGHPHGHMTMYDGSFWVSDFKQMHGLYPGPGYRAAKPSYSVYRHQLITSAPSV